MRITRRRFLRATVASAGGVMVGAGCGDDTENRADTGTDTPLDAGADASVDGGGDASLDGAADTAADTAADEGIDAGPSIDPALFFTLSVASGDPKPDSVILWTRLSDDEVGGDLPVSLQVAVDEAFEDLVELDGGTELALTARADADGCVKVRITQLTSATTYFYRFVYTKDGLTVTSRTGRTKTAPATDADVAVRFAYVSCQDFNGKYYNTYKRLVREEIDFFVHLGDYVYETTGDPTFQDTTPGRIVEFTDIDGAIPVEEDGESYFAAASLDNYRQLYRIHRSDQWLQRMHELAPMVAVWDDHEFADDCYGATSTLTAGREDELNIPRRQNANQAWFEYMPVDYFEPEFDYDRAVEPPDDIRIYRDLRFGANVHLVMTDLRLFRTDHLVAEDAWPGRVAMTEDQVVAQEGTLPEWAEPYVDIGTFADGAYVPVVAAAASEGEFDPAQAAGLVAVRYINNIVAARIEAGDDSVALIEDTDALPRGLAYMTLGKTSSFSSIGSRYLAVFEPFVAHARHRHAQSGGESENILGDAQQTWFLDTMRGSDARWKVWGNEFSLVSRVVSARGLAVPEEFQNNYLLSAEDWDGSPNKRDELINELASVGNVVAISGDIHAFFASTPWVSGQPDKRIVEFVGSSISTNPYEKLLVRTAAADPALRAAGAAAIALLVEDLLIGPDPGSNPQLGYANISENGFCIAEVNSTHFAVDFYGTDGANARTDMAEADVEAAFTVTKFRTEAGGADLFREIDGAWLRWNSDTFSWV